MCESAAYILQEGKEEKILDSVDILETTGDQIRLVSLFGEEKIVRGRVKVLSLVEHKIILEPL
jgi:predicted RNA-binding protein